MPPRLCRLLYAAWPDLEKSLTSIGTIVLNAVMAATTPLLKAACVINPSRYLFSILLSQGIHFIVRMKPHWVPVKEFVKSRKKDITITMEVPDDQALERKNHPDCTT